VIKRIFGGKSGNSGGKLKRALKKPPSLKIEIRIKQQLKKWIHTRECPQDYVESNKC